MEPPATGIGTDTGSGPAEALREIDRDRYLASLLMPPAIRADVTTLFLFNAEVASIRDRTAEPMAGEMRLQWWREVIEGGRAAEAAGHPLAGRLLELIARRGLATAALTRLLDARIFDLYDDPMPDRATYEAYAGETASTVLQLSVSIADPANAAAHADAAGHAGVAQAVAGHLMLLPIHRSRGQVFVPGDLLAATGLDRTSFLAGDERTKLDSAIDAFAALGREHLGKAREALADVPKEVRRVFLPVAIAGGVFARAEVLKGDCLTRSPQPSPLQRQWRIWRAALSGRL
ncbi:phytoene/squalene synthase family protein [Pseudohoeflea coraliihabitans]|uniref:Phytoene/squalene synthase family protein n=1 Tax=Pseudohoeflea coraliihabitans TaxID=2860393 RepID=A0ABS6WR53_9HYPH|nr:phytoene/squalene synthase family protein [Pseudohoeflea sp. DP4N28-3]MBW3098133.1 phytoene/squalene synthase family protein [Pseudohoeflea sp. DP4N28-3]